MTCLRIFLSLFILGGLLGAAERPVPTARDPQYGDTTAWTKDVLKSYHAQETWPKGRLWTWAKPGTSMNEKQDPLNPANWIEDGKPATTPFDKDTDFAFPAAANGGGYFVNLPGNKSQVSWCRHMTIERGANVSWLHGALGNTWIKAGGKLTVLTFIGGDKHAFLRNDNKESWWMVDHLFCDKAPAASIEIIGPFSVDDSYHFNSGMTILGVDSSLTPQARSNLNIQPGAALALLSGAVYRKQANQTYATDLLVRGRLLGGLPERPLTRDATVGLSWKGKRRFLGGKNDTFRGENGDDVALIIMAASNHSEYVAEKGGWIGTEMPAGALQVYSADPTKARLVFDWNRLPVSGEAAKGGPRMEENYKQLCAVKTPFIELMLLGNVQLDGVLFNHIATGGIVVKDPAEVGT